MGAPNGRFDSHADHRPVRRSPGGAGMSEVENLLDEAEQRIGLYRDALVDVLAGLREALSNAQEVIHLSECLRPPNRGLPCWKECREARVALKAAEELVR